ncbi:class I SAM-dependent methyltransferase [Patescibacteria group bacterium]
MNKRIFRFKKPVALIEPAYFWLHAKPKVLKWFLAFAPISAFIFEIRFLRKIFFKIDFNERVVENTFVLANIPELPAKILDFGVTSSWLSIRLASLGYKITGLDMRPYEFSHPNIKLIRGDLFETSLPKEEYDAILVVSTLEHVDADERALQILSESLKIGGKLFITVPFGQEAILPSHRVYSKKRLEKIVPPNLNIKKIAYYKKDSSMVWLESKEEDVSLVDSSRESNAVVCLILEKQ